MCLRCRIAGPSLALRIGLAMLLTTPGCVVDSVCFDDSDCLGQTFCDETTGRCYHCNSAADCPDESQNCLPSGRCEQACPRGTGTLDCPVGMVSIEGAFCIDIFEASRGDATRVDAGVDGSKATSRAEVMPWQVVDNSEAQLACSRAGKDLCTEQQWQCACRGPQSHIYAYGDSYEPTTCNGIDKHCFCEGCADACPFPGCYSQCGAAFRLEATGTNAGCTNAYGVYDMNGNVWEHVKGGDETRIRGGAFNCLDSQTLHRCDYVPGDWRPSARGFRCCWTPEGSSP